MKKGTETRKFNDSLLLFRNTGDPVTFSLFGPSPVPAMGLISCDVSVKKASKKGKKKATKKKTTKKK